MNTMIEKIARRICLDNAIDPDRMICRFMPEFIDTRLMGGMYSGFIIPKEDYQIHQWMMFVPFIRSCLEAMREPTDEMLFVGQQWTNDPDDRFGLHRYQAMIDAALKDI